MNDASQLPQADIGILGGSGFYTFTGRPDDGTNPSFDVDIVETVKVDTPWGEPSAPVTIGEFRRPGSEPVRVAFLPRHGVEHQYPPHRVNYRANVDAMRQLGVRALVSPFAAGSLRPDFKPGEFVVCDQLVDRTRGRDSTYYDTFDDGPAHISFADPYDPRLRQAMLDAAQSIGTTVHDGGTVVVINGPRFSTRAESDWHRAAGWDVVNMTQAPEAALAREAGVPYAGIALITDYDAGLKEDPNVVPVTQEAVMKLIGDNVDRVRELLAAAVFAMA